MSSITQAVGAVQIAVFGFFGPMGSKTTVSKQRYCVCNGPKGLIARMDLLKCPKPMIAGKELSSVSQLS